ncbi:MAG: transcriptional regulator [Gammaproteobacteria bacterium]|nr:transcriptional regulator [Gammaproteobacteria bacterium]
MTLVFCIGQSAHLFAAELLIVEQSDCPYCDRFNDEIGQVYAKTDEGKVAPLVRLQLRDTWPKTYESIAKPAVTPTFILVHNGKEIDRLHGYQGDEFFWFLLNDMLDKLPENVQTQNRL